MTSLPPTTPEYRPQRAASRRASFAFAVRGLKTLVATQANARIHAAATFSVALLAFGLELDPSGWVAIALACTLVWLAEALNTSIEFLSDAVTDRHHPLIAHAKDVAAAAVLLSSAGAVTVGAFVLGPPLWVLVSGP